MEENFLQKILGERRAALERFIRVRCGDAAETDDLIQDLWIKCLEVRGRVDDPAAYLFRMADNLILDRRRSAQRRGGRDAAWTSLHSEGEGAAHTPSAERAVIDRDFLIKVDRAIDALGPKTAAVFRRFRLDGVAQRDIAAEMGVSLSAVEKHLQRAYRAVLDVRAALDAGLTAPERLKSSREGRNDS